VENQMIRPIMLWMTSRSRSSLVSKIFAEHGVWWGDTQVTDPAGYDWYENQTIKALQKRVFGGLRTKNPIIPPIHPVHRFIEELQPLIPNKRWSVKTGVEFFHAFQPLKPYNVFILRDPRGVADSICRKRLGTDWDEAFQTATWRFELMKHYSEKYGGVFINTDNIVAGDMTDTKLVVEYCDIIYEPSAVERAIQ